MINMEYRNQHPPYVRRKDKTPFILIVVLFVWFILVNVGIVVIGNGWNRMMHCANPITDMEITDCTGDINPADPMEDEDAYTYPDVRDRD